jgi:hypothetical protein
VAWSICLFLALAGDYRDRLLDPSVRVTNLPVALSQVLDINLKAPAIITKEVVKIMPEQAPPTVPIRGIWSKTDDTAHVHEGV